MRFHDMVEGVNPGKRIGNCRNYYFEMGKVETACVMGRGVGRIRGGSHPRFKSESGRTELDTVEKVYSGARNPRLGNEATGPERRGLIVQMASDEVEDLWREGGRHRGFLLGQSSGSHDRGSDGSYYSSLTKLYNRFFS